MKSLCVWAVLKIQGFVGKRFLPFFPSPSPFFYSLHFCAAILCSRTPQKRLLHRLLCIHCNIGTGCSKFDPGGILEWRSLVLFGSVYFTLTTLNSTKQWHWKTFQFWVILLLKTILLQVLGTQKTTIRLIYYHHTIDTPRTISLLKYRWLMEWYMGARGKFKTNMANSSGELIEFFRPHKNEVNLYVTNISRQLEKEVVQVGISYCIICFSV